MSLSVYCGDCVGTIPWPEDFPLHGLLRVNSADQADLLLFPWFWQNFQQPVNSSQLDPGKPQLVEALAGRLAHLELCSHQTGKPLLLFRYHDDSSALPHRHGWVWQTSLYASSRRLTEAALPAFHPDVVVLATALGITPPKPLPWQPAPSVGFCGQSIPLQLPWPQQVKSSLRSLLGRQQPGPLGYWLRRAAMRRCLRAQPAITCSFLITDPTDTAPAALQKQRFLNNLFASAYVLCGSGYGNYSYRFYEALCAGRVPVLLDSDVVLPFDDQIPWNELIVRVSTAEVHNTPELILSFHRQFSSSDFVAHQQRLRRIWERFCTPSGFQRSLEQVLRRRVRR